MKERLESIIAQKNTVIKCETVEECEKLVDFYLKYINPDDVPFSKYTHYGYLNDMCIQLSLANWMYCNSAYYKEKDYNIISFKDLLDKNPRKIRGFEVVSDVHRKTTGEIKLPTRGTSKAMAYDFYCNEDYLVQPNEIVKIWTDVKAYMQDNEALILNVRSSMGGKFMLANTQGWIDADYYENENNDGNIGIFLKNISNEPITISKGDRVAQGMFIPFLVADNGNTDVIRKGGFGHTDK